MSLAVFAFVWVFAAPFAVCYLALRRLRRVSALIAMLVALSLSGGALTACFLALKGWAPVEEPSRWSGVARIGMASARAALPSLKVGTLSVAWPKRAAPRN